MAERTIVEPSRPRRPTVVATLVEAAINVLAGLTNAALGDLMARGLELAKATTGIEQHLGAGLTALLHDGFKAAGKDNVKLAAKEVLDHAQPAADPAAGAAQSPRTRYLQETQRQTLSTVVALQAGFVRHAHELKRVPIDTLQAVSARLNPAAARAFGDRFGQLVIDEWVNFGKAACEQGEEMCDVEHRPAHRSRLDNVLAPYGVVQIRVRVEGGALVLERASLPGVSDAVVASIQQEGVTLGRLHLHRHVELVDPEATHLPPGGFQLSPDGQPTFAVARVPGPARSLWASVAGVRSDLASDADVEAGARAIQRWLDTVDCRCIQGAPGAAS
jgi:hypothetical protein